MIRKQGEKDMSSDIGRMYLFLSQQENWFSKADASGDGVLTKTEFRAFIKGESSNWNGETSNLDDIINRFWREIDTKQSTKHIEGTLFTDLNAVKEGTSEYKNYQNKEAYYVKLASVCKDIQIALSELDKQYGIDAANLAVNIVSSLTGAVEAYRVTEGATPEGLLTDESFLASLNNAIKCLEKTCNHSFSPDIFKSCSAAKSSFGKSTYRSINSEKS